MTFSASDRAFHELLIARIQRLKVHIILRRILSPFALFSYILVSLHDRYQEIRPPDGASENTTMGDGSAGSEEQHLLTRPVAIHFNNVSTFNTKMTGHYLYLPLVLNTSAIHQRGRRGTTHSLCKYGP